MGEKAKRLVTKLDEIYGILVFSHDDENIIDELINYIDNTDKTKLDLKSDLLKLENELNTEKTTIKKEEMDNYSNEWNKMASHKCDIRNLVNGKLKYKNL